MRPELCVGAVVVDDERVLLVRRGHGPAEGEWSFPGGKVERGETLAEAVVREVAEETGIEVVCDDLIGWVERISDEHHYVIMSFGVTVVGSSEPTAGSDAGEAEWVPLGALFTYSLSEGLADFLADNGLLEQRGSVAEELNLITGDRS